MHRKVPRLLPAATALLAAVSPASMAEPLAEERDCVIVPQEVVEVSSAVPGLLDEVLVERSDGVRAGELLARLESRVEKASLALAEAWASIDSEERIEATSGALDRRRHDRITQLYESKAVALDDRDRAQTDAALSALRLRQAREKRWIRDLDARKAQAAVERRAVRSPIDGVVVERFRAAGEYVENQPIVRIARLDPLQVETVLPMALFGRVQAGMLAEVRAEHTPDKAHRAMVRVVDRMGDVASGTFGVRLTLPNPGSRIPAGLRCRLRLLPEETAAIPDAHPAPGAADPEPTTPTSPEETEAPLETPAPASRLRPVALHRNVRPDHDGSETTGLPATEPSEPSPLRCATLGPLDDQEAARRLADAVAAQGARAWVDGKATAERVGFIVVTQAAPDLEAGIRLAQRVRGAGVEDLQVIRTGQYTNRVSLGVYAGAVMAERRREQVAARGVVAEVLERTRTRTQWWVRVMSDDPDGTPAGAFTDAVAEVPAACTSSDSRRASLLDASDAAS